MNLKKHKASIITAIIGLIVIFGFYSYINKTYINKVENTVYSMNGISGDIGSELEGLSIAFKRENIDCSGFMTYDCSIDDAKIRIESLDKDIFLIKTVNIYGLTRHGFQSGRKYHPKVEVLGIEISNELNSTNPTTDKAKELKELLTPFNLFVEVDRDYFKKKGESQSHVILKYSSKVASIELTGNLHTVVRRSGDLLMIDKNLSITKDEMRAVAEKRNPLKVVTIIDNFKLSIEDKKSISELLYNMYSYYMTAYKSDKEREFFNIYTIGYSSPEVATQKRFKDELNQRFNSLIPHYDDAYMTVYLNTINRLIQGELKTVTLTGKNKGGFTLFQMKEIDNLGEFKKNEQKFFDLNVSSEAR